MAGVVGRNSPFFVQNEAGYGDIWQENSSQSLRGVKGYWDLYPGAAAESAIHFAPNNGKYACA